MVIRLLLSLGFICGTMLAAEPPALDVSAGPAKSPAALSDATQRATEKAVSSWMNGMLRNSSAGSLVQQEKQPAKTSGNVLIATTEPKPLKMCSIPLADAKLPANTYFPMPAIKAPPSNQIDSMPVMIGKVCGQQGEK